MNRDAFRERCLKRDQGQCVVPWCSETVTPQETGDVHHIIERKLWADGGYILENGATVCDFHHELAEDNYIPPQAFWRWLEVEPTTPENMPTDVNKWGDELQSPRWDDHKKHIKYPSTDHPEWDEPHTMRSLTDFVQVPLIVTIKMDGGNAMIVKDAENPIRARNGQNAPHKSFDLLKQLYSQKNLYSKIPENIQIFGEWIYEKHSIHYGCECDDSCEDTGPYLLNAVDSSNVSQNLDAYFQVFGVYDTDYKVWLGWPKVEEWAEKLSFPTVPVYKYEVQFEEEYELHEKIPHWAIDVIEEGHEGLVVRSKYPFHYGQFEDRIVKYVRDGHVQPGEKHWKFRDNPINNVD